MRLSLILSLLILTSCLPTKKPNTPDDKESTENPCDLACARLSELGCPEAEPDEEGATCSEICTETMESGLVDLEPQRIAESTECP